MVSTPFLYTEALILIKSSLGKSGQTTSKLSLNACLTCKAIIALGVLDLLGRTFKREPTDVNTGLA